MSMPPAGVAGEMDDETVIQAEIEFELNNINLDDGHEEEGEDIGEIHDQHSLENYDLDVGGELGDYIKKIQEQTAKFERELEECDELISHVDRPADKGTSTALIPYDDHNLLSELAKDSGCDIEQYKQKILLELEQDDDILHDDLADLIDEASNDLDPVQGEGFQSIEEQGAYQTGDLAVRDDGRDNGELGEAELGSGDGLSLAIHRALEDGMDPNEVPVSKELVPTDSRAGIQLKLREQLERLEERYRERTERIKKEEAFKRNEEEVRQRRITEERQWKKQEIEKEEQKLRDEREAADRQIKEEQETAERQMRDQIKKFEEEMKQLTAETERQKKELEETRRDEENRQLHRQQKSALVIQKTYRGYRIRKEFRPILKDKSEERKKIKEEERVKEIEIEIEQREIKKKKHLEEERLRKEDEKRQKEEEKIKKEEERKAKEEEKRRKKDEEEKQKQEEKRRKEEEKRLAEEEKKRKKEEEKRRKEEEAERKKEEKRLKDEEEKRKKEEEKRKKEEEKRKKEEEKKLREEERKRRQTEELRLKEEQKLKAEEDKRLKEQERQNSLDTESNKLKEKEGKKTDSDEQRSLSSDNKQDSDIFPDKSLEFHNKLSKDNKKQVVNEMEQNTKDVPTPKTDDKNENGSVELENKNVEKVKNPVNAVSKGNGHSGVEDKQEKTPRSSRTPHPPSSPRKKPVLKDIQKSKEKESVETGTGKSAEPVDVLPEPLEAMRLVFIKECLPWSKISNEPWKLKGVTSRKPLRRPSSAKKLSPLTEDIILQAGRVASLKQVTTVELCDLPGNNISPLGQCWGLKYLSMTKCNLRVVEGLQQCKQLLYISMKDNQIEYIDLKDVGSLQVLDMSHNNLSSVHGLDNCTNLRWLDLSHNNITRLGGLETLRRLHTLRLSHNQLISTKGLSDTPTIQVLDVSSNHLPAVEDLDKLCLLLSLNVSSNNILKVPCLKNQVLLYELLLTDNSITSLEELSVSWLPLLQKAIMAQNSMLESECLQNCLLLRQLDFSNNQFSDPEVLLRCIEKCQYLEQLVLDENPVLEEVDNSFFSTLQEKLPRLQSPQSKVPRKCLPLKPRSSFEAMCLSQAHIYKEMFTHLEQDIRLEGEKSSDLAHKCDSLFKFCDKTFKLAVEHRYAHEYGEVSVAMPTAPITPKSGRPNSARKLVPKGETFTSPKDLFEQALQTSDKTFVVPQPSQVTAVSAKPTKTKLSSDYSNPKDLFERALKSSANNKNFSNSGSISLVKQDLSNSERPKGIANGYSTSQATRKSDDHYTRAAVTIQAAWRGWLVRHEISQQTKIWLAAITIQAGWRGYCVRKWYRTVIEKRREIENIDPELVDKLHRAATTIQAAWRGYWLRSKLLAALEYARLEEEDDGMDLNGDEFDLDKFMDFNEGLLDDDWRPPSTPVIPASNPILRKPPSGRPKVPPINTGERPPSNPRRAWKNLESPLSDIHNPLGRIPRPPSTVSSGADTQRTGISKKEEKLSEEWGFKDSSTAHLMMQRAKKMKYNAERKKKISKLDPKQRLRLFQRLQEVTHHDQPISVPQRKTLPRKEYFKARHDEIAQKEREKREEYSTRASRIYEWLHMPVNNYPVTDSVINQGLNQVHRFASENNLPDVQAGRRVQLVSGPGSIELQSVDSASTAGDQRRRFSVGSASSVTNKLPPIQSNSAPTVRVKERMSWRSAKVNQSTGWGGGKKRGERL